MGGEGKSDGVDGGENLVYGWDIFSLCLKWRRITSWNILYRFWEKRIAGIGKMGYNRVGYEITYLFCRAP